ncbi:MAG TPA: nitroreductase [Candidatus Nealsonbacteria bacterium]|uniref:Nitroreductase domain-containing protein n=1 Tax=marine sediment metagenome TaxID=412755 RepID=A0A0F9XN13_9ZZZZ|nr:nitroreductase [Candidatus Nealsonbacteria bacterium]HEB46387.1 nitroreductase [Candidatus Nealsonbacteria bacterium]
MDVQEAVKTRRAVRSYKPDAVPEESLKRILEAVRLAPSAKNKQDWKFIVVKNPEKRKQLSEAARNQEFIAQTPMVIVGVALDPDYIMGSEVPAYAVDLGIAMEHIALSAVEEGLGTCWVGGFSQKEVKEVLKIPEKYKVVALMPLGFPADKPASKIRKDLEEITCYENFTE